VPWALKIGLCQFSYRHTGILWKKGVALEILGFAPILRTPVHVNAVKGKGMPMREGSIILRTTIAGILGIAIVRNSIDEQIPSCIRAMPTKTVAMASCPAKPQISNDHHEEALTPTPIIGQLAGISHSVSMAYGELTKATPVSASAADCPTKEQAPLHLERKDAAPPEEMPLPLRNVASNFFASEYVPRPRQFTPPDQYNNLVVHIQSSCPDKDQAPLHLERKDVDTANDTPLAPPPNPNVIRQIMASYQDPASYQTPQPVLRSAAHL
jgi:hypothetical protein